MKVSLCTTCKGRLWQLRQTLPQNLLYLDDHSEIILLDYQSPDGLKDYIYTEHSLALAQGRLKYFQMVEVMPIPQAMRKTSPIV